MKIAKNQIKNWEKIQRDKYRCGKLSQGLIEKLELIPGWKWDIDFDDAINKKQQLIIMGKNGEPRPNQKKHSLGASLGGYTSKKSTSYDLKFDTEIREIAPLWFITSNIKNKNALIAMAKNGENRPNQKKNQLGHRLGSYTNSASKSFDYEFNNQIRELAPHWFIDTVSDNKNKLLEMAKTKTKKPIQGKHPLGGVLLQYTNHKNPCYDPNFEKEIRELSPRWFIDTTLEKKKKLIDMARNKEERPIQGKHPLGCVISFYTNPKNPCYDPNFEKEIRELAPHWFVDTALENKNKLLEMAKNGESRPNSKKNPLGRALCGYLSKRKRGCYDPNFEKEIHKLAPHWFIDTALENKKKLLEMAKNGESRPHQNTHELGSALISYTNESGCYDPVFDNAIRKLNPRWFENTADDNKKQLLIMAKNKEVRPSAKKGVLGQALCRYTNENSQSYDSVFDVCVRKLMPIWFIDTALVNKNKLLEMAKNGENRPKRKDGTLSNALSNYIFKHGETYDEKFDKEIRNLAPHWFKKGLK